MVCPHSARARFRKARTRSRSIPAPRITVDERQILGASAYSAGVSSAYGTGAPAFTSVEFTGTVSVDETLSLTAAGTSFNYTTNNFAEFDITAGGATSTVSGDASSFTLTGAGENTNATYTIGFNATELKLLATAAAATTTEIESTESAVGISTAAFDVSAASGFLDNAVTNVTLTITGSAGAATVTLSDGRGGTASATVDLLSATALDFTIAGGDNDGATFNLNLASAGLAAGDTVDATVSYKVRGEFTGDRTASFDVRGTNAGESATLETEQLVDGNDANNLTVQLNETNTSTVTVVSQNVQTDGQGLQLDFAQNFWNDRSDIDNAIRQLDAAKLKLRSASSSLSTNSNTLLTRLDFTASFSDVLKEGAGKLTLADQNEEGANILTLQTRQQLGTISLSLANQAQQAILRLF